MSGWKFHHTQAISYFTPFSVCELWAFIYAYCRGSSPQEIVDNQCIQLERLHNKVSDSNKRIPKLFMIPKFHKRPYRYRFIAGASNATTKRLAIDVNLCLKLIKKIHKGYCESVYNRNGYNYFWSVDNSKEVLDKLTLESGWLFYGPGNGYNFPYPRLLRVK